MGCCVCVFACMRDVKEVHTTVCRQLPSAFLCVCVCVCVHAKRGRQKHRQAEGGHVQAVGRVHERLGVVAGRPLLTLGALPRRQHLVHTDRATVQIL